MKYTPLASVAYLAAVASAEHPSLTFGVLNFEHGSYLTEGRMDPIVNPGTEAGHYHVINGGDAFNINIQGEDMLKSTCTNSKVADDFSAYWAPAMFFQHKDSPGNFTKVPLNRMVVYYFFDQTKDKIEPFPAGLQMMIGSPDKRTPPSTPLEVIAHPEGEEVEIQPIKWTCPRSTSDPPSWPADSDGSKAGMAGNGNAGVGFPFAKCDGQYSPLRGDVNFPSCYDPSKELNDYGNNMVYPTEKWGDYGAYVERNCPEGFVHTPRLLFELYFDTQAFDDMWEPDGTWQPFVLSNGDSTGYSYHADFINGWKPETLQNLIDTCNAGHEGLHICTGENPNSDCKLDPEIKEPVSIMEDAGMVWIEHLPGENEVTGFGADVQDHHGGGSSSETEDEPSSTSSETSAPASTTSTPAETPTPAEYQAEMNVLAVEEPEEMETVVNVVTVYSTATVPYGQPTPVAKRRHGHNHMARHQHH